MSSPISGFTAVPNPYMVPLLFLQSLLIGAGFGIGYQGERRKLSAMSNKEFNEVDLGLYAFDQFKGILARNDFGKMLDLMHPLTEKLAKSFGELIKNLPDIFKEFGSGLTNQQQQGGSVIRPAAYYGSTGIPLGALKASDPYTQWLQTKELLEEQLKQFVNIAPSPTPPPTQSQINKSRVERDIERSRQAASRVKPIQTVYNPAPFSSRQSQVDTRAANKKILQKNLSSLQGTLQLQKLELMRFQQTTNQNRGTRSEKNRATAKRNRSISILQSIVRDTAKKVANAKTILRNYR